MRFLVSAAVVALATSPAMADGIVDNVNGITVADGGRVIAETARQLFKEVTG